MKASKKLLVLVPLLGLVGFSAPSSSSVTAPLVGSHTWDFTEVFSNADGTVQFMELKECCGGATETGLPTHLFTSTSESFTPGGPALTPPTGTKNYLIGTAAFAALPGAPAPDAIIPAGSVPFLSAAGDTITYTPWDAWTFGAIPTDGINSFRRDGSTGLNSPTNYLGATGSVNASVGVPALPSPTLIVLVIASVLSGAVLLARRSRHANAS